MPNVVPFQINKDGKVSCRKDRTLNKRELERVLRKALGKENLVIISLHPRQKMVTAIYNDCDKKTFIILANVTFMGGKEGQHRKDLKRIQYNARWRDYYQEHCNDGEVKWMGLYSFANMNVFVDFSPETYLKKHEGKSMISKGGHKAQYSCHVYLNDIMHGYNDGTFQKTDRFGNTITTVNQQNLADYLNNGAVSVNPIFRVINEVNKTIEFNEWIRADKGIEYIRSLDNKGINYNQFRLNLWNGFYIEAKYSEYLWNNPSKFLASI